VALYIQKPIFWNTNRYVRPSGARATSGFPKERGYGHEEWNNSHRMELTRRGQSYRVFHTEGIGAAPLADNVNQTFVFMTASHDGIQQLVGVAGNATGLFARQEDREKIASDLRLNDFWTDAWSQPTVQIQHSNSQPAFLKHWKADLHWIPNWICPQDCFLWLDSPITLDARSITGKSRLLNMAASSLKCNAWFIAGSRASPLRGSAPVQMSAAAFSNPVSVAAEC